MEAIQVKETEVISRERGKFAVVIKTPTDEAKYSSVLSEIQSFVRNEKQDNTLIVTRLSDGELFYFNLFRDVEEHNIISFNLDRKHYEMRLCKFLNGWSEVDIHNLTELVKYFNEKFEELR